MSENTEKPGEGGWTITGLTPKGKLVLEILNELERVQNKLTKTKKIAYIAITLLSTAIMMFAFSVAIYFFGKDIQKYIMPPTHRVVIERNNS